MAEATGSAANGGMTMGNIWFSFEGRIGRKDYWLKFVLPYLGISIVTAILDGAAGTYVAVDPATGEGIGLISLFAGLALIWPSLAAGAKRCHDRNRSGWFQAIVLIPIIGALWLLVELGFLKGTDGENRFGRDSLAG